MGLDDINYKQISMVMESWELCAQRFSCREEVGLQILLELFQLDPSIKLVFGFQPKHDVGKSPLLRMGALVHGVNIVKMIDSLMSLLGPDTELLAILLAEQGERHARMGVKSTHVPLLGKACKNVICTLVPENHWTDEIDAAWTVIFNEVSSEMIKMMS
jgi:hemoglobin-like flavoprotein